MTTALLEKKLTEELQKEAPAERELVGPGFMGNLLADMRRFAEDVDPFFAGLGLRRRPLFANVLRAPLAPWTPTIEMFVAKGAIVVRAELPGLTKDDVKVQMVTGALTIEGERKYRRRLRRRATSRRSASTEPSIARSRFRRRQRLARQRPSSRTGSWR